MKKFLLTLMSLMTFLTAEEVVITLSSAEPINGIQFQLSGGGVYTSQYVAQTNQFNQFIDIAAQFYSTIIVTPGGFVIMFDGQEILSHQQVVLLKLY